MSKRRARSVTRAADPPHGKYVTCLGCGYRQWWPEPGHIDPRRFRPCHRCGGKHWQQ